MIIGATSSPLHVSLPPLIQGPYLFELYILQSGPEWRAVVSFVSKYFTTQSKDLIKIDFDLVLPYSFFKKMENPTKKTLKSILIMDKMCILKPTSFLVGICEWLI